MKLGQIASALNASVEPEFAHVEITGVNGIEHAQTGEITFVANPKYAGLATPCMPTPDATYGTNGRSENKKTAARHASSQRYRSKKSCRMCISLDITASSGHTTIGMS